MSNDTAISVKHLSKHFRLPHEKTRTLRKAFVRIFRKNTYEDFVALDNISFDVRRGEFFSIVGSNGSGKSTLLSIIAGIYSKYDGKVTVNGVISPFLALGIGFNQELSGRDNVYLNSTILGIPKEEMDEKFEQIVEFSELGRFIDQRVGNYSSGMRARLAFAVAIHADHDILLMDEVLAVGDEKFKQKCLTKFEELINGGQTIVFVSHSLPTVEKYSDRVMVLNNGVNEGVFDDPKKAIALYNSLNV